MKNVAAPMICQKCHSRRLSPVLDKGHRWCKKCREKAFLKLQGEVAPDALRLRRVVPYGDYYAWLALYRAVMTGREKKAIYVTKTSIRIDRTWIVGRA